MMFGLRRRAALIESTERLGSTTLHAAQGPLREFAYLDEVSLQSLLASLVGALPSEITSMSSRSAESELSGTAGAAPALLAKAELTARFKGASSSGSQVLSRAVAESLFKNLRDLCDERLVWSPMKSAHQPIDLERGSLIELEVELGPDPVYGFNATMGVMSDLANDYPALLNDPTTAMILAESGPVNQVLERLLVGLIPLKSPALALRAGLVDGQAVAGTAEFFESAGLASEVLHVVGVTEQDKYWRDVRRVLFSRDRYTVLGRISRSGIQRSWTPVKLTEVMRDLVPQFPDAITRVGRVGYSTPVNIREEENRIALERALTDFALQVGGESAVQRTDEISQRASQLRDEARSLTSQGHAFAQMGDWLIESGIVAELPKNERAIRSEARTRAGLRANSDPQSLSDFARSEHQPEPSTEMLLDLDVIAIYW